MFRLRTLDPVGTGRPWIDIRHYLGAAAFDPRPAAIVVFAASWCLPCRRELPRLAAIRSELGRVPVWVVDVDTTPEGACSLAELTRPLALEMLHDRHGIVSRRYGVRELPHVVVVGGDGRIVAQLSGAAVDLERIAAEARRAAHGHQ